MLCDQNQNFERSLLIIAFRKLMTSGAKENSRRSTGTGSGASVPPPPKEQRRTVKQRQEDVDEVLLLH